MRIWQILVKCLSYYTLYFFGWNWTRIFGELTLTHQICQNFLLPIFFCIVQGCMIGMTKCIVDYQWSYCTHLPQLFNQFDIYLWNSVELYILRTCWNQVVYMLKTTLWPLWSVLVLSSTNNFKQHSSLWITAVRLQYCLICNTRMYTDFNALAWHRIHLERLWLTAYCLTVHFPFQCFMLGDVITIKTACKR